MAIVIEINDIDKTGEIVTSSVMLNRALTNQIDTLTFEIKRANSSGYKPVLNNKVEVIEDGTLIFGGQIVSIDEEVDGLVEKVKISCKDFSFDMDKKLVVKTYSSMTVAAIIADINTNFLPAGYTVTNVVCPIIVNYIAFNYEMPSKCFQQLATITDYDWYVDEAKNIYFFQKGSQSAPFNLTDTNGKYIYNSLKIKKDIKNIRNSIIVRGGTYQGSTYTEDQAADGNKTTFTFAYQYSNYIVKVNGVTKTVGLDFIDDPTTKDCLYNFNEKAVKFPTASKPTAGQIVTIVGNPHIPVVTKIADSASVALYGEFQYKIIDKSIASKEAARDRAQAELAGWAAQINEGSFSTYETGLKVGQKIRIQSTNRGIDDYFIISRLSSKMHTPTQMEHTATLVTKQTYGVIEFLQNLLIQKDKEIEISSDEVLDLVLQFSETMGITDSMTAPVSTSGPYKWQPDSLSPVYSPKIKWNFFTWS